MANQTTDVNATRTETNDPYVKATHSSASDPHPMPPRQISEKELADKALAAERPQQAASKNAGKTGQPLATSKGVPDTGSKPASADAKPHTLEQAHREKVEREREIMRDPHEKENKEHLPSNRPMPHYGHGSDGVSALHIKEIRPLESDPSKSVLSFFESYDPVTVTAPWITANLPAAGGWYVVDGKGPRYLNAVDFKARYQRTAVA